MVDSGADNLGRGTLVLGKPNVESAESHHRHFHAGSAQFALGHGPTRWQIDIVGSRRSRLRLIGYFAPSRKDPSPRLPQGRSQKRRDRNVRRFR